MTSIEPLDEAPSEALTEAEVALVESEGLSEAKVKKPTPTVRDYISGTRVRATPEEVEAVQVFSRRLVEELGYPRSHIQTRPQFSVRSTPSGRSGKADSYPLDIAVFDSEEHLESNVKVIVECKRKNRKDGEEQLKIYMNMSPSAQVGVWFNGKDHLYLLREFVDGQVAWSYLPTPPRFGQAIRHRFTQAERPCCSN